MQRRGITMPELLVMAATAALLAAIVLPVFYGRTHCEGRRATCQSNLKQITLAIQPYRQDSDERLPPARLAALSGRNFEPAYGWVDALQPYLKSFAVFQCPSEPTAPAKPPRQEPWLLAQDRQLTDYWANRYLLGRNPSKMKLQARLILLGEGNDGRETCDARYSLSVLPAALKSTEASPALRHWNGANYAFADGHVKWLKPYQLEESTWIFFPEEAP